MKKSRILIAGAGSIGTRHIRNLLSLGYRNLVVCDSSREKVEEVSRLGAFKTYTDVRKALETERPDVVFICTPTHLHVPSAALALDSGAHVFIEKPISHSLRGIDALRKKAEKKKKVVMVACNFRFSKGFQTLEEILRKKTSGTPLLCRVAVGYYLPTARKGISHTHTYAAGTKGGGVLLDSGAHVVDYLIELFGTIKTGKVVKGTKHTIGTAREETAALFLRHASGVLSASVLDYVSRKPIHRIEVVTNTGTLTLDLKADILTYENEKRTELLYKGNGDGNAMFREEVKHFLKCVQSGLTPKQDIAMATETLRTLLRF